MIVRPYRNRTWTRLLFRYRPYWWRRDRKGGQ